MQTPRKRYSAAFKARVALEALKGHTTGNEFARLYGVQPPQITHGKHRLHKEVPQMFSARRDKREHDQAALQAQLDPQIGPLKVELAWVKNKAGLAP
jgi:transposase-like protein